MVYCRIAIQLVQNAINCAMRSHFSFSTEYGAAKAGAACGTMKYVDKTYLDDDGFLGKYSQIFGNNLHLRMPSSPLLMSLI